MDVYFIGSSIHLAKLVSMVVKYGEAYFYERALNINTKVVTI
jgi:hypothetical protein